MFKGSFSDRGSTRSTVILAFTTVAILLGGAFYLRDHITAERTHELASLVAEHLQTARAEARVEVTFAEDGSVYLVEEAEAPAETQAPAKETDVEVTFAEDGSVYLVEEEKATASLEAQKTALSTDELNQALAEEILRLTNQRRTENGLPPLARHEALENAAAEHSQEMRELNYFSHTSPTPGRSTTRQRVNQYGVNPQLVAENIFECSGYDVELTSKFAVEAFMKSPGHRHNLLNPSATHIGIGFVAEGGNVSVTQVFGAGL